MDKYEQKFTSLDLNVISYLAKHAGKKFSQRDVAKALKVSPTAISNSIKKLSGQDLVQVDVTKTINFVSYNRDNPFAIRLKRIENLKQIELVGLAEYLEEQLPGATIILFGSYSKGEDVFSSDIDIAVIGRKNKSVNLEFFEKKLEKLININYYTSFNEMHKNLRNNILNGIVLKGSVEL